MGRDSDRALDAELVVAVRAGDPDAFGQLFDRWYDRAADVARRILHDADRAADVAQDALLAAWQRLDTLDDTASFGGWLLRITRNRALDLLRRAHDLPTLDEELAVMQQHSVAERVAELGDPASIAADHELAEWIWSAADGLGERDALVLDLSVRHDLEPAEIALVLDVERTHAAQLVHRVRERLARSMQAQVVWNDGRPRCERLRALLAEKEITSFDEDAVAVIERHARSCASCDERRRTRLAPAAMFGAVPVFALGQRRADAAEALARLGVPMGGSRELAVARAKPLWRRPGVLAGVAAGTVLAVTVVLAVLGVLEIGGGSDDTVGAVGTVATLQAQPSSSLATAAADATATSQSEVLPPVVTSTPETSPPPVTAPPATAPAHTEPPPTQPPATTTSITTTTAAADLDPPGVGVTWAFTSQDFPRLLVQAEASDDQGIERIEIWFAPAAGDLTLWQTCATSPCLWTSPNNEPGTRVRLHAVAYDLAGNWMQTATEVLLVP